MPTTCRVTVTVQMCAEARSPFLAPATLMVVHCGQGGRVLLAVSEYMNGASHMVYRHGLRVHSGRVLFSVFFISIQADLVVVGRTDRLCSSTP